MRNAIFYSDQIGSVWFRCVWTSSGRHDPDPHGYMQLSRCMHSAVFEACDALMLIFETIDIIFCS